MTRQVEVAPGGKAGLLSKLIEMGERVPTTWVVSSDVGGDELTRTVDETLDPNQRYAVRSSASVEDGAEASYAGQFTTVLDVPRDGVADAIDRVRGSLASDRVAAYRDHLHATDEVTMTVIVQPMVPAAASGVAFSRNPMTGLNEVVVEAVDGRGDRLVDDGVTPDRWIHRWGAFTEEPDSGVLDPRVAASIVAGTRRIADRYGAPVDLEWVWDGNNVWWVQLRPITGIEEVAIYSNRISREVMPGMIKPLVWSVNVPMVNRAWVDLFTEAIGPNDIEPESLARAFAYRSYFNMSSIGDIFELLGMPRDSLELLLGLPAGSDQPSFRPTAGTMRLMPRLLRVATGKARYGKTVDIEVASLLAAYRPFERRELGSRSDSALLSDVRALSELGTRAAYANIVTPLLANLYHAVLRNRLIRAGLDPEAVNVAGTAELAELNPNVHLDAFGHRLDELDEASRIQLRETGYAGLPDDLRVQVDAFLGQFGHLSSSGNDFSVASWRETPDDVVTMMLDHAATHGDATRLEWSEVELVLSPISLPVLRRLQGRTEEFVVYRERVSFAYTYGYGLFRRYFLEIGRRLAERGFLEEADDVMLLYLDEVRELLLDGRLESDPKIVVAERRVEIESLRDIEMPDVIYGDDFVPTPNWSPGDRLQGIPTSRGHHRGTLRVVLDTGDFAKVGPGDVIAIPYSDVGWTPLFARAGAVVAEAGGMLSHSSIVAREYHIPCVVSAAGATRLPDGATVTVDGYSGAVVVEASPTAAGDP